MSRSADPFSNTQILNSGKSTNVFTSLLNCSKIEGAKVTDFTSVIAISIKESKYSSKATKLFELAEGSVERSMFSLFADICCLGDNTKKVYEGFIEKKRKRKTTNKKQARSSRDDNDVDDTELDADWRVFDVLDENADQQQPNGTTTTTTTNNNRRSNNSTNGRFAVDQIVMYNTETNTTTNLTPNDVTHYIAKMSNESMDGELYLECVRPSFDKMSSFRSNGAIYDFDEKWQGFRLYLFTFNRTHPHVVMEDIMKDATLISTSDNNKYSATVDMMMKEKACFYVPHIQEMRTMKSTLSLVTRYIKIHSNNMSRKENEYFQIFKTKTIYDMYRDIKEKISDMENLKLSSNNPGDESPLSTADGFAIPRSNNRRRQTRSVWRNSVLRNGGAEGNQQQQTQNNHLDNTENNGDSPINSNNANPRALQSNNNTDYMLDLEDKINEIWAIRALMPSSDISYLNPFVFFSLDVAFSKIKAESLEESQAHIQNYVTEVPDPVYTENHDPEYRMTHYSRECVRKKVFTFPRPECVYIASSPRDFGETFHTQVIPWKSAHTEMARRNDIHHARLMLTTQGLMRDIQESEANFSVLDKRNLLVYDIILDFYERCHKGMIDIRHRIDATYYDTSVNQQEFRKAMSADFVKIIRKASRDTTKTAPMFKAACKFLENYTSGTGSPIRRLGSCFKMYDVKLERSANLYVNMLRIFKEDMNIPSLCHAIFLMYMTVLSMNLDFELMRLNPMFYGDPGTGKTEMMKRLSRILISSGIIQDFTDATESSISSDREYIGIVINKDELGQNDYVVTSKGVHGFTKFFLSFLTQCMITVRRCNPVGSVRKEVVHYIPSNAPVVMNVNINPWYALNRQSASRMMLCYCSKDSSNDEYNFNKTFEENMGGKSGDSDSEQYLKMMQVIFSIVAKMSRSLIIPDINTHVVATVVTMLKKAVMSTKIGDMLWAEEMFNRGMFKARIIAMTLTLMTAIWTNVDSPMAKMNSFSDTGSFVQWVMDTFPHQMFCTLQTAVIAVTFCFEQFVDITVLKVIDAIGHHCGYYKSDGCKSKVSDKDLKNPMLKNVVPVTGSQVIEAQKERLIKFITQKTKELRMKEKEINDMRKEMLATNERILKMRTSSNNNNSGNLNENDFDIYEKTERQLSKNFTYRNLVKKRDELEAIINENQLELSNITGSPIQSFTSNTAAGSSSINPNNSNEEEYYKGNYRPLKSTDRYTGIIIHPDPTIRNVSIFASKLMADMRFEKFINEEDVEKVIKNMTHRSINLKGCGDFVDSNYSYKVKARRTTRYQTPNSFKGPNNPATSGKTSDSLSDNDNNEGDELDISNDYINSKSSWLFKESDPCKKIKADFIVSLYGILEQSIKFNNDCLTKTNKQIKRSTESPTAKDVGSILLITMYINRYILNCYKNIVVQNNNKGITRKIIDIYRETIKANGIQKKCNDSPAYSASLVFHVVLMVLKTIPQLISETVEEISRKEASANTATTNTTEKVNNTNKESVLEAFKVVLKTIGKNTKNRDHKVEAVVEEMLIKYIKKTIEDTIKKCGEDIEIHSKDERYPTDLVGMVIPLTKSDDFTRIIRTCEDAYASYGEDKDIISTMVRFSKGSTGSTNGRTNDCFDSSTDIIDIIAQQSSKIAKGADSSSANNSSQDESSSKEEKKQKKRKSDEISKNLEVTEIDRDSLLKSIYDRANINSSKKVFTERESSSIVNTRNMRSLSDGEDDEDGDNDEEEDDNDDGDGDNEKEQEEYDNGYQVHYESGNDSNTDTNNNNNKDNNNNKRSTKRGSGKNKNKQTTNNKQLTNDSSTTNAKKNKEATKTRKSKEKVLLSFSNNMGHETIALDDIGETCEMYMEAEETYKYIETYRDNNGEVLENSNNRKSKKNLQARDQYYSVFSKGFDKNLIEFKDINHKHEKELQICKSIFNANYQNIMKTFVKLLYTCGTRERDIILCNIEFQNAMPNLATLRGKANNADNYYISLHNKYKDMGIQYPKKVACYIYKGVVENTAKSGKTRNTSKTEIIVDDFEQHDTEEKREEYKRRYGFQTCEIRYNCETDPDRKDRLKVYADLDDYNYDVHCHINGLYPTEEDRVNDPKNYEEKKRKYELYHPRNIEKEIYNNIRNDENKEWAPKEFVKYHNYVCDIEEKVKKRKAEAGIEMEYRRVHSSTIHINKNTEDSSSDDENQ